MSEHTWREALDALEADVAETERAVLLVQTPEGFPLDLADRPTWSAPAEPLPAALAPRAADLLDRQRAAADKLTRALASNRRNQRLAAQIDHSTARGAVYVDRAV